VTDLRALLEAGDAPWVTQVASRLDSAMEEATADDATPVVKWEWACRSPPFLGESDPHYYHLDARTDRRWRDASQVLLSASQVESTQVHTSVREDYYVPVPAWWSLVEVAVGVPARPPRVVAYFATALRRGACTPAAAILATQWVTEVAGVWYAFARVKGYLWHLSPSLISLMAGLRSANWAECGPGGGALLRRAGGTAPGVGLGLRCPTPRPPSQRCGRGVPPGVCALHQTTGGWPARPV